jgi:hypothetical protein
MRAVLAVLAVLAGLLVAVPAEAQRCTADSQCSRTGLPSYATCSGDTLIVRRSTCVGGMCREMEVSRQNCGSPYPDSGRCLGNAFEITSNRCDALQGRCDSRNDRDLCLPSCSCRDNVLRVSTGQCSPNIGCHRAVLQCKSGCTCDPEPRCLDAPARQ